MPRPPMDGDRQQVNLEQTASLAAAAAAAAATAAAAAATAATTSTVAAAPTHVAAHTCGRAPAPFAWAAVSSSTPADRASESALSEC